MPRGESAQLVYREAYAGDRALLARLDDLLADVFRLDLGPLDAIGGRDPDYTPFSYFDEAGRCVANISAFPLPLLVDGKRIEAAGLQSGAVRPEWRRRGLYREVTRRALDWCRAWAKTHILLYTGEPALYTPWGFRVVPEHSFVGPAPAPQGRPAARALALTSPDDVSLLKRLLAARAPVSTRVGLRAHGAMFLYNALARPSLALHLLPDAEAVVASTVLLDGTFRLVDIVGPAIPGLASILGAMGVEPSRVEVCFPTDRLDWTGSPHAFARDDALMILGPPLRALDEPFMLPATAVF